MYIYARKKNMLQSNFVASKLIKNKSIRNILLSKKNSKKIFKTNAFKKYLLYTLIKS